MFPRVFAVLFLTLSACSFDLPRSAPEAQGVSSAAVLDFVGELDRTVHDMHSMMLLRHGQVIAEGWWAPYEPDAPHTLWSLSKSFTSTAIGIAIGEGKLSVDDEVLKFFPEDAPAEPSKNLKLMRVSDLLRMVTGQQTEPVHPPGDLSKKAFLAHPVPFKPGTHFLYNTNATYMLSAIVQKVTGQTTLEYLRPRLFEPLGFKDPHWLSSSEGINFGGYGLSLRTEEIARFGQLLLQKGQWQGKQLVPAEWIEAASARQVSNGSNPKSDWDQGYGYQFWRCRHGAFRGDGAFGQYCVVMPEQDAVLVITSGIKDMQHPLDLVWEKLLPAMKAEALPANEEAAAKLKERLKSLSLTLSQLPSQAAFGSLGKKFVFPANDRNLEALTLSHSQKDHLNELTVRFNGVDQRIPFGRDKWTTTRLTWDKRPEQPVAALGWETGPDAFAVKLCFIESPDELTIVLTATTDGNLHYNAEWNIGFKPTKEPELIGKPE
jgi:CubicO group peptidase (beta-lactamase class C family)